MSVDETLLLCPGIAARSGLALEPFSSQCSGESRDRANPPPLDLPASAAQPGEKASPHSTASLRGVTRVG